MEPRRRQSVVRWVIAAAVLAALVVGGLAVARYAQPAVTVTEVVEGPAVQAFYATGTLEPADREHPMRAGFAGFVENPSKSKPYADKGDRVAKGQILAIIFDESVQRAYDTALADIAEKRARADEKSSPVFQGYSDRISAYQELRESAEREYARFGKGIEAGAANQADYDRSLDRLKDIVAKLQSYKAEKVEMRLKMDRELSEAESNLKIATWNLEQMKVVSPIDGFVLDKPQQIGAKVNVNDLIVTVADTAPANLVMRAQVDEEDVTKVWRPDVCERMQDILRPIFGLDRLLTCWKPQRQIVRMSLYAFEDRSFTGHVERIYPKADPDRRTFEVDVRIDEPSLRMQAGMTGELAFEMSHKDRTLVAPSQALQSGKFWTLRNGKLTGIAAEPGITGVERVEITSGLKAGDRVIISPIAGMEEGQGVRIGATVDPATAAGINKPKSKELFRGGF